MTGLPELNPSKRVDAALGAGVAAVIACLIVLLVVRAFAPTRSILAATSNYWDVLPRCETGGQWPQRGSYYVGGLGIWYGNWQKWAPRVGVHKPAYPASREEQIRVARYGRRVDRAYWGCMRVVGMPW